MKSIAIIGMSFRFPGTSKEKFWLDLLAGRDLVSTVDASRWPLGAFSHPNPKNRGTSYSFAAGSLGDLSGFDAGFFGISPREAAQMDPQQRLMLELGWEALENAGIKPSSMRGSRCGVYVGISSVDYGMRMADDLAAVDSLTIMGNTSSIVANRLSYAFDLRGPSMAIDTACSSSMVAFHQACQSIRSGETSMAFAGGVSLHLHPLGFVAFSKSSMLSRKGKCSVFDASADGYVRSEGGGIFVLKDYEQAMADGDPILAVVCATALNTDGKKTGLTVPSRAAQIELLTEAYSNANIKPDDISYIEAHGTGTPVGDPIEAGALGEAIGKKRKPGNPLLIGSVKSNLGHLEAASGVAGLVKAIYCLNNRILPETIHFKKLNLNIDIDHWKLRVVAANTDLPKIGNLIIGVNSFGFGGSNTHVILKSATDRVNTAKRNRGRAAQDSTVPLVISGRTEAALKATASEMAIFLRSNTETPIYDVAYTAALRRDWHPYRGIVFGASHNSLALSLEGFAAGKTSDNPVVTNTALNSPALVGFVYSGNGSQWENMGRRLLAEESVFRDAVRKVDKLFKQYADFSLELELAGENGKDRYAMTEIAQPALFAFQVGVTEMLLSRGVTPSAVVGHSVGEVAAAWACGALSLEYAVSVIYHRSRLQGTTKGKGQMTAVVMSTEAIKELLLTNTLAARIGIAGVNSIRGVTLEGESSALGVLEGILLCENVVFKRLDLDYAFHGPSMDPIKDELLDALGQLCPSVQHFPFVSSVTGEVKAGPLLNGEYWWQNVRKPVMFAQAMATLQKMDISTIVEIGPHPVLKSYIESGLKGGGMTEGRALATVVRDDDRPSRVWDAASKVLLSGAAVDLAVLFPTPANLVDLPNYPWQRERHWHAVSAESRLLLQRQRIHPLLGYPLTEHDFCWESQIDAYLQPSLADHVVDGSMVFPGAAFAELGLAAASQWLGDRQQAAYLQLEELEIFAPLVFCADSAKLLRVTLDPLDGRFSVAARERFDEGAWTIHANGRVLKEARTIKSESVAPTRPTRAPDIFGAQHTQIAHRMGLQYGPGFCSVACVWVDGLSVLADLVLPVKIESEIKEYFLHPALLDSAFQLVIHTLIGHTTVNDNAAFVPVRIDSIVYYRDAGIPCLASAELVRVTKHSGCANFSLFDAQGRCVAVAHNVRFKRVPLRNDVQNYTNFFEYVAIPKGLKDSLPGFHPYLLRAAKTALVRTAVQLGKDAVLQSYAHQVEPLLDALSVSYAAHALKSLIDDANYLSDARATELTQHHRETARLLVWLIELLEEEGVLTRKPAGWDFNAQVDSIAPYTIWNLLITDFPEYSGIIGAVGRAGLYLDQLIKGRVSLPDLRTTGMSGGFILPQIFGQSGLNTLSNGLACVVDDALSQLPDDGRFSVAEICAGSPMFETAILSNSNRDRIDYLAICSEDDLSQYSFANSEALSKLPIRRVKFPQRGGADEASLVSTCDLIVVAHDFTDRDCALSALQQAFLMLKPSGVLIFLAVPAARWLDLTFGASACWWRSSDGHGEAGRARDATYWSNCLRHLGFEEAEVIGMPTGVSLDSALPYMLLAGKPKEVAPVALLVPPVKAQVWLVLIEGKLTPDLVAAQVIGQLRHAGRMVVVLIKERHDDWTQVSVMTSLLSQTVVENGPIAGLVDLMSHSGGIKDPVIAPSQRCLIVAAMVQACEKLQLKLDCCFVTLEASSYLLDSVVRSTRSGTKKEAAQQADASLWAFVGTVRNEPLLLTARLIDLEQVATENARAQATALVFELLNPVGETEVLLTATGAVYVPRLRSKPRYPSLRSEAGGGENATLVFKAPGQLRNLRWEPSAVHAPLPDEVQIAVTATGLNFRDIMYSLGALSDEAVETGFAGPTLGLECSGIVTVVGSQVDNFSRGDRVVAFASGSFGKFVTTKAGAVARIPNDMSLEAASTIPTTFFTSYYAIVHLARLQAGESILIHGAVGGVGMAAIQIAKHLGAKIFATAGSDEKRDFLRLMGIEQIFDSRTLAFADQILEATEGRGVDVVLNSLAGEAINQNLRVLRPFGRFLELGKRDFYENTRIGLRPFRNNISYFGIDADQLLIQQPDLSARLFKEVIAWFADGILHPIPFTTFEADHVVEAFRYMQQAKQIGKVVITYRNGISRVERPALEASTLELDANASYLVTGGLGGFGLKTACWLVAKGARCLVLVSRSGAATEEAQAEVAAMQSQGVQVMVVACDISDEREVEALFANLFTSMPPLRGVIHAAAIFEDALVSNMDARQLNRVFAPKIGGALNLHRQTLDMPLDFFVLYSSVTTVLGNPGQAAYVAANAALEALARARRSAKLPALCVKWGPIEDTGVLTRSTQVRDLLKSRMGGRFLQAEEALEILGELIVSDETEVCVADLDWASISRFLPSAKEPKFSDLFAGRDRDGSVVQQTEDVAQMLARLSSDQLNVAFRRMLKSEIAEILRVAPDKIDDNCSVYDLGLDSLMGVELALAVESRFGAKLSVMVLSDSPTVAKLTDKIIAQLKGASVDTEPSMTSNLEAKVASTAHQHGVSIDAVDTEDFAAKLKTSQTLPLQRMIH